MLLGILLTCQIIVCVGLVVTILLQRSEGGALGMGGGGTSGFMTARGAGNLLTRTTAILATIFFVLSMGLTILGNMERSASSVVDRQEIEAIDLTKMRDGAPPPPEPVPAPAQKGLSLEDIQAPLPQSAPSAAPAPQSAPAKAPQ